MTIADKSKKQPPEDFARIDSFREDEDTGGAAAPPVRPRDQTEQKQKPDLPDQLSKRPKGPAQP